MQQEHVNIDRFSGDYDNVSGTFCSSSERTPTPCTLDEKSSVSLTLQRTKDAVEKHMCQRILFIFNQAYPTLTTNLAYSCNREVITEIARQLSNVLVCLLDVGAGALHDKVVQRPAVVCHLQQRIDICS